MSIEALAKQYVYWPEVNNPYQKNIHFASTPAMDIFKFVRTFINQPKSHIEADVFRFYTLNQALNEVRKNDYNILDDKALDLYHQYCQEVEVISQRLFAYLITICAMEARHVNDPRILEGIKDDLIMNSDDIQDDDSNYWDIMANATLNATQEEEAISTYKRQIKDIYLYQNYKLKYDTFWQVHQAITAFHAKDDNKGVMMKDLMMNLSDYAHHLSIEDVLKSICLIFEQGDFEDDYGGDAWFDIAQHALNFAQGKINAEVFIDQAFSIEHNSGHIFNKSVIYQTPDAYTLTLVQPWAGRMHNVMVNFSQHQLILNMQHKGLLGAFLHTNFSKVKNSIVLTEDNLHYPAAFKQKFLDFFAPDNVPDDIIRECMKDTSKAMADMCDLLSQIKQDIHHKNPKLISYVQNFISLQEMDYVKMFDGMNLLDIDEEEVLELSEGQMIMCDSVHDFEHFAKKTHKRMRKFNFSSFNLSDVADHKMRKELLGNKAYGVAHMMRLGLPVPKALVLPTINAQSFFDYQQMWNDTLKQKAQGILSDIAPNGLFSVRSGATVSMPGMMDTILNVGIDDSNYEALCQTMGHDVVIDCAIKFMNLFSQSVLGVQEALSNKIHEACFTFETRLKAKGFILQPHKVFPLSREEQLLYSVGGVFNSWFSPRAKTYRQIHHIDESIGTAVIIQQMVFGNLNHNSCTGVVFSRDCITGKKGIVGEFLIKAQGEDVVSGTVTPQNIEQFKIVFPKLYDELSHICEHLERIDGCIQDIEFTVENGQLYILQKRKAVCTASAQALITQEMIKQKILPSHAFMDNLQVQALMPRVDVSTQDKPLGKGLVANTGVVHGVIVKNMSDIEHYKKSKMHMIYMASHTTPDDAPLMAKTDAFLTNTGGFTSHAAILSRSWNKPCVVGVEGLNLQSGTRITLDANEGHVYMDFVPLKKASRQHINKLIELILSEQGLNRQTINQKLNEDVSLINQVNEKKSWMESYIVKKITYNKPQKTDKFFDLSHKLATMMIINHQKNKQSI